MSPVVKLTRANVDRVIASLPLSDDDRALLVGTLAAERASTDVTAAVAPPKRTIATKQEVMKLLAIASSRTIDAMIRDERIPRDAVIRVGRLVRFDLERVVDALRGKNVTTETKGAAWARRRASLRAVEGGRAS